MAICLSVVPMARADGTITIHLVNDGTDNLVITVFDKNRRHRQMVLSGQIVYGNASIATSITANSSSQGHLAWRAMTTDRDMPRCGHGEVAHVNDGAKIRISPDSACPRHHH